MPLLGKTLKKQEFFLKNPYTFDEKTILWTVLEILFFQSLFTGYYLPLAISKKLNFFSEKTFVFKNSQTFARSEKLYYLSRFLRQIFYVYLLVVLEKILSFVSKDPSIFLKNSIVKALKKFIVSSTFCNKLSTFNDFKKRRFFRKTPLFFWKNPIFELFEKSYFRRFLRQFCKF